MSLDQFQILAKLGDGSYSSVYRVKRIEDGQDYALKKVKIQSLSDREKENALNEVRILASIKNPFVASYKQAFFDEPSNSLCIVMEFADDGDVFQRICECQNQKQFLKEKHVWKILIQVVRGLKSLHDLKILHRDMKSANIFLYKDGAAKLGDLNVSKVAKKGLLYTQTGTPYYASPEVWKDQPYDLKSDIWSFGCVVYEMCALVPPFRADDMNGLFKRVLKGQYPPIPSHFSIDMRTLIKNFLQVQPASRPDTAQILEMPIVQKRMKKYFSQKDGSPSPTMEERVSNVELLRTIKLGQNLFKLSLPEAAYAENQNYQTVPAPSNYLVRKKSNAKIFDDKHNAQSLPHIRRITSDDEMPNSSATEEPVRRKGQVANAETETADTSLKRNQNRNTKSTKQLVKMATETSGDEIQQQISSRKIELQISPHQVDQKSLKGKALSKSESTKQLLQNDKSSAKNRPDLEKQRASIEPAIPEENDPYSQEIRQVTQGKKIPKQELQEQQLQNLANKIERKQARQNSIENDSTDANRKPTLPERNVLQNLKNSPSLPDINDQNLVQINGISVKKRSYAENLQKISDSKKYNRVVSIYSQQANYQKQIKEVRGNRSLEPENRALTSLENGLPDIYNNGYSKILKAQQDYTYKQITDQNSSAMITKLLSRKQSYEKMLRADEVTVGSINIRSSIVEPLSSSKNKNTELKANQLANKQRINAIGGHGVQKQIQLMELMANARGRKQLDAVRNSRVQENLLDLDVTGQTIGNRRLPQKNYQSSAEL